MTRSETTLNLAGMLALPAIFLAISTGPLEAAEPAGATPERALARQILDATSISGGLVVHLGCGDGKLTAALKAHDGYLVHGLDADPANVRQARAEIRSLGIYGSVSVDQLHGNRLPYVDNLVNLVVADDPGPVPMDEMMRVLSPNGVAYVKQEGKWTTTVKPPAAGTDDWTHYLHDATGNPVAHDTVVAPPRRLQWVGSPRWARHHDHMASMTALVSSGGRLFYVIDEGPTASIQLPAKWRLVARDAFNGTVLWKR
ncbi:MAG: class I SAM-dependent methyltransferase, partial [Planctomycetes bacterium]|nr:class I SAM-dependent methyltransferase [Planctomycetota bacterium]